MSTLYGPAKPSGGSALARLIYLAGEVHDGAIEHQLSVPRAVPLRQLLNRDPLLRMTRQLTSIKGE